MHQFHRAFCPSSLTVRSGTANVTVFRVVYDIMWFHPGESSEDLGLLAVIVHPLLHCRRHCLFLCFQVFLRPLIVPLFLGGS